MIDKNQYSSAHNIWIQPHSKQTKQTNPRNHRPKRTLLKAFSCFSIGHSNVTSCKLLGWSNKTSSFRVTLFKMAIAKKSQVSDSPGESHHQSGTAAWEDSQNRRVHSDQVTYLEIMNLDPMRSAFPTKEKDHLNIDMSGKTNYSRPLMAKASVWGLKGTLKPKGFKQVTLKQSSIKLPWI